MSKRNLLHLFMSVVIGVIIALVALNILTKPKPVKPVVTPEPQKQPVETAIIPEAPEAPAAPPETPAVAVAPAPEVPVQVTAPVKEGITFKPEFQKGMTFIAWSGEGYANPNSVKAMEQMAALGVEWACLIPTWYQFQYNTTQIYPVKDKSASDEALVSAIRKLHELKFKVMLKPHLDLVESKGKWRGEITMANPDDWKAWFDSYTAFILHYAEMAARENVEIFCIGTELTNPALTQPGSFKELIKKTREVYKGPLTYAANWSQEFSAIEFWNDLDYAGIDPYFPLVTSLRPTVEQLKSVWGDWLKEIEPWQQKIDKPVIITEVGYNSTVGASDEPWHHSPVGELDLQLQANCYEALLQTFWDKPWFYGVYWWYWGVHPNMGGVSNRGFTPQNKPAQEVIKQWYKEKPVPEKAY